MFEKRPIVTVDAILLTIHQGVLKVLLQRRTSGPFTDDWALPGGYVHVNEDNDVDDVLQRVLAEKTGIKDLYFEQMKTYAGKLRDPRGWSVSIGFLGLVNYDDIDIESLAENVSLFAVETLRYLAFDHLEMLQDALERLRGKGAYSSLPAAFIDTEFTFYELRKSYEVALGKKIHANVFRQKIKSLKILEPTGSMSNKAGVRPASTYRLIQHATFNRELGGR